MPASLSIKNVPDTLVDALRERASTNHRSIQGELMHILESAVAPRPFPALALVHRARELGLSSRGTTAMVRADRDRRKVRPR